VSYGLVSLGGTLANYVAIGAFVFVTGTLTPIVAIEFEYVRSAVSLRTLSGVFFIVGVGVNLVFVTLFESAPAYIVISSSIFLMYLFIAYTIYQTRQ
jgi:hypothetical protein